MCMCRHTGTVAERVPVPCEIVRRHRAEGSGWMGTHSQSSSLARGESRVQ